LSAGSYCFDSYWHTSAFSPRSAARRKAQSVQKTNKKPIQRPCNKRNKLQIK
jgi:hypothetical protein